MSQLTVTLHKSHTKITAWNCFWSGAGCWQDSHVNRLSRKPCLVTPRGSGPHHTNAQATGEGVGGPVVHQRPYFRWADLFLPLSTTQEGQLDPSPQCRYCWSSGKQRERVCKAVLRKK